MKKLIALLGGFTVVAGSATTVISCKKPESDQQKANDIAKKLNDFFKDKSAIKVGSDEAITLQKGKDIPSSIKNAIAAAYSGLDKLLGSAKLISDSDETISTSATDKALNLKVQLNKATSSDAIKNIKVTVESSQAAADRILGVISPKLPANTTIFVDLDANKDLPANTVITDQKVLDGIKAAYKGNLEKDLEGAKLLPTAAVTIDQDLNNISLKVKYNNATSSNSTAALKITRQSKDQFKANEAMDKLSAKFRANTTIIIKSTETITLDSNNVIGNQKVVNAISEAYGPNYSKDMNGGQLYLVADSNVSLPKDQAAGVNITLKVKVNNATSSGELSTLTLWVLDSKYNAEKALENLKTKFSSEQTLTIPAIQSDLTISAGDEIQSNSEIYKAIKKAYGDDKFDAALLGQKLYAQNTVVISHQGTPSAILNIKVGDGTYKTTGYLDKLKFQAQSGA